MVTPVLAVNFHDLLRISFRLFLGIFLSPTFFVLYNLGNLILGDCKGDLKNAAENHLKCLVCYTKPVCSFVSSTQLRRVSRPCFTGLPPEWHLHRSVKLLCPPPGHGREAGLLAAYLQTRVSVLTYCVSLADAIKVFRWWACCFKLCASRETSSFHSNTQLCKAYCFLLLYHWNFAHDKCVVAL